MPTTRLISMHQNTGKTIASCLTARTAYAINPDKTNGGELVTAYECDPMTVQSEFLLSKKQYDEITSRKQGSNVIAYQIRQSFRPGEVTAELANKVGYELGLAFTKGNHAFIVATHIDKSHIHNHIIFNSTTLDCTRKFRDFLGSGRAIAKLSDRICLQHGLSIVEHPRNTGRHYGKWLGDKKPLTHSDKLRQSIDQVLADSPQNFEDFLHKLQALGYEIKRGKHHAFKSPQQKRFTRLRSLGRSYSDDEIRAAIAGTATHTSKSRAGRQEKPLNLLVDIQAKLDEGKGKGYEHWAKIFNLKQMAKTIAFLRENNLLQYDELAQRANECADNFSRLNAEIKATKRRIDEIAELKNHIYNYSKTREIYIAYRKSGYAQSFHDRHRTDIALHKSAKAAFERTGAKKLPTIKALQAEYGELIDRNKTAYAHYQQAKKQQKEVLTAKANVDVVLGTGFGQSGRREVRGER